MGVWLCPLFHTPHNEQGLGNGKRIWTLPLQACVSCKIAAYSSHIFCIFKATYFKLVSSIFVWDGSNTLQFSHSVVSDSLRPHELQHARPPCPSSTPRACSNSCSSSWWCHPTLSFSVVPFSSCLQSFPASGFFPMSRFFTSGGQTIGTSVSASVCPLNIQDWFPLGWTGWISLQSKGLSRVFSKNSSKAINFLALSFLHSPTLTSIHDHWKNHSLD